MSLFCCGFGIRKAVKKTVCGRIHKKPAALRKACLRLLIFRYIFLQWDARLDAISSLAFFMLESVCSGLPELTPQPESSVLTHKSPGSYLFTESMPHIWGSKKIIGNIFQSRIKFPVGFQNFIGRFFIDGLIVGNIPIQVAGKEPGILLIC